MTASTPPALPSDRSFGLTFTVVLALAGAWLLWKSSAYYLVAWAAALAFLAAALAFPARLHPLNVAWMRLALVLNRVVSPVVMGVMYFGLLTPIAAGMRLAGRDALRRRAEPGISSYWIRREPPGPAGSTFPLQF